MSLIAEEDILKGEKDDIEKLNAFLNCDESSDDTDENSDADDVLEVETTETSDPHTDNAQNINIEFNDITLYDQQVQSILSKISNVNLSTILVLNKTQQSLIIEAIKKYKSLLRHCEEQLQRIKLMRSQLSNKKNKDNRLNSYYRCGVPYFKDITHRRSCPPNIDTTNKIKKGELTLIDLPSCKFWLDHEKDILRKAVLVQSKKIRIQRQARQGNNALETFEDWNEKPLKECAFPISEKNVLIDWLYISIHDLKNRHTDEACKAMWYQHLHPHLNSKPYGPRETENLTEIAAKYNYQNWDAIAEELNTNRSGYHCCLFYRLNAQKETKKHVKWTPEEDAQLMALIEKYKIGNYIPWGRLVYHLPNREKAQIYNRYKQTLVKDHKKGKFSKQEDLIILSLVKKFGDNFRLIATYFKERSISQIRARYKSLALRQKCKFKAKQWTEEDDRKIIEFVKANSNKGQPISWSQLEKFFDDPQRNRTNIRHRWNTIKNYLDSSFEGDLSSIRRPQKRLKPSQIKESDLQTVLLKLNDEESKICNLNLNDISKEVLCHEPKAEIIDQFLQIFITNFSKIKIDHPITIKEEDVASAIFLVTVLHGRINVNVLFNKKFRNCYSEKNETKISVILKDITVKMSEMPDQTVYTFLKTFYGLPVDSVDVKTINLILPKCFVSTDDMVQMYATIKPFLKYVIWNDSELDTFYNRKGGRFERNLKCPYFTAEKSLLVYEKSLITNAQSVTCHNFLLDSECDRKFTAPRLTEIFKVRYLALLSLKSMETIVLNFVHKPMQLDSECLPEREKRKPKILSRGRPRKRLPGGRFKHKREATPEDEMVDEPQMVVENEDSITRNIKIEESTSSTEVNDHNIQMDPQSEINDDDEAIIEATATERFQLSAR